MAASLAGSIALSACGGSSPPASPSASGSPNGAVQVIPVNYELVANQPNRVLIGLVLPDNRFVAYGKVQMRFTPPDVSGGAAGEKSDVVEGTYLAVPGTDLGEPGADPRAITPETARGAYDLEGVRFGGTGTWAVEVAARVQGVGVVQGSAQLDVLGEPSVPAVGETAPASNHAVIGDPGTPPAQIDSRAQGETPIPDPTLHRISIADALQAGRPLVVVFSTPVYCVSRFCGPVTDMVERLERRYGNDAAFIHVEIWKDFESNIVNEAAGEWLLRDGAVNEPWLFMVGADGRIAARWDNLFTQPELEEGLDALLG